MCHVQCVPSSSLPPLPVHRIRFFYSTNHGTNSIYGYLYCRRVVGLKPLPPPGARGAKTRRDKPKHDNRAALSFVHCVMSHHDTLQYPNLVNCQMSVSSTTASSRPPVKLPQQCLDAVNTSIPPPYDFSVGEF